MIALSVTVRCLLIFSTVTAMSIEKRPKVIIVGAGAAGISAASRLLQNGINDILILEAEERIGGRIHTIQIREYKVDMGGQWVHGEKGNAAFELAWPLGLLAKPNETRDSQKFYGSSGESLSIELSEDIGNYFAQITNELEDIDNLITGSMGEYIDKKCNEYFNKHPEINEELRKPLLMWMHQLEMALDGADNVYDVSAKSLRDYVGNDGDHAINWKTNTYEMIFDILMKKYPNPKEELPIINKTVLNKKVCKINYGKEIIQVTTKDDKIYKADHLIFTGSLGVLKAEYKNIFEPSLPEKQRNAIENIGFGHNAKILLYYEKPWWKYEDIYTSSLFWTQQDREELENDPEGKWMLSVYEILKIEFKPHLLCLWLSGKNVQEMENTPEELFKKQTITIINKFFGKKFNLSEPTEIKRTFWNSNENFRGSYSYRSLQSDIKKATAQDLGSPVLIDNKPVILFAGEATEPDYYSTVHGAITSGWREADRLINYYSRIIAS